MDGDISWSDRFMELGVSLIKDDIGSPGGGMPHISSLLRVPHTAM
jgi:hypothetical protein